MSPIFWAVYVDPLLQRLQYLAAGLVMEAVCYADDVLLIALMEAFAQEANIIFSTNNQVKVKVHIGNW